MKYFVKLCVAVLSVVLFLGCNSSETDSSGNESVADKVLSDSNSDETALKLAVKVANKQCPQQFDFMTWTGVKLIDKDVVYIYELSDSDASEVLMDEVLCPDEELKNSILNEFQKENDAEMQEFIRLCKKTKSNLVSRYKLGNRKRDITIGYDEL